MTTFVLAFAILMGCVAIMSVGVVFANKPIKGSCGGFNALGMKEGCEICGGDQDKCESVKLNKKQGNVDHLVYDAMDVSNATKDEKRPGGKR